MRRLLAITLGVALAGVGTVALGARNSSGTHSLPTGTPFVSGTTISSSVMNNVLGDISTELTNSLDRSGRGGLLAPLRGVDGACASGSGPAYAFTSETDLGLYRSGTDQLAVCANGAKRFEVTGAGAAVTGTLSASGATTLSSSATVANTLTVDQANTNNGTFSSQNRLQFGNGSGEGIASKRTSGGNQYGLDLYTNYTARLSIAQSGTIDAHGNAITNSTTNFVVAFMVGNGCSSVTTQQHDGTHAVSINSHTEGTCYISLTGATPTTTIVVCSVLAAGPAFIQAFSNTSNQIVVSTYSGTTNNLNDYGFACVVTKL